MAATTWHSHLWKVADRLVCGVFFSFHDHLPQQKDRKATTQAASPTRVAGRCLLAGGRKATTRFYPAQKSNVCIALAAPPALSFRAGKRRPPAGANTTNPHNRPQRGRHRVSPPRWGWDAAQTAGGPQTPSNGPPRGTRFESRSAGAERPSGLPLGV